MYQQMVTFGDAIKRAFSNYCVFTGRASRSEYWWWVLFTYLVGWIIGIPAAGSTFALLKELSDGSDPSTVITAMSMRSYNFFDYIDYMWSIAIILPSLGLFFRRLHDTGRSGWNFLWILLPLVGLIVIIVFLCLPSQPVANRYGEVPNLY